MSDQLNCPPKHGFDLWGIVVLALWGVFVPILIFEFPSSLGWPFVALTSAFFVSSFIVAWFVYSFHKRAFIERHSAVLSRVKELVRQYRIDIYKKGTSNSKDEILVNFSHDCHDFVEYILNQENKKGESICNQLDEQSEAIKELREELNECSSQLTAANNGPVAAFLRAINDIRKDRNYVPAPGVGRVIIDPIFHAMFLNPQLDALIRHPLVDRLRSVKQLSFAYQEQPSAIHSRLSHSLGVARNTEFALERILERGKLYTIGSDGHGKVEKLEIPLEKRSELILLAKTAALLHDLGHAPFGHALDRFTRAKLRIEGVAINGKPDKYYSAQYIRDVLKDTLIKYELDIDALLYILRGRPEKDVKYRWKTEYLDLVAAIIDSDLDADRIDFLMRDSHSTGLPYGSINSPELLSSMLPTKDVYSGETSSSTSYGIAYDEKAGGFIAHAVSGRIEMYENCYETQAKISSETMLTNAVRYFLESHKQAKVQDLLVLTDDELLALILANSSPASPEQKLVELLVKQQYFVPVIQPIFLREEKRHYKSLECEAYLEFVGDPNKFAIDEYNRPLEWQQRLVSVLRSDEQWMVEVYATPYDRLDLEETELTLIREKEDGTFEHFPLANYEKEKEMVKALKDRVKGNPRIEVFAHRELGETKLEQIRQGCDKLFRPNVSAKLSSDDFAAT